MQCLGVIILRSWSLSEKRSHREKQIHLDTATFLTTSPDTVVVKIDDIGKCLYTPTEEVSSNQKQLIIDSVSCAITHVCIACYKSIGSFNAAATFLKCAKCGMKQKTANIWNSMKCQILCGKERFTINGSVIKAKSILKSFTEADEIKNHLLSNQTSQWR